MLKAMLIRFDYKTVLLRNVPGWPKTQSEMVLSPNDEEVASSKKIIPRPNQVIPFFRPKKIKKTILFGAAYTYIADIRDYLLPSPGTQSLYICVNCLMGLRYS